MKNTRIGWTDASWNPWVGCTRLGGRPGCGVCYMFEFRKRLGQDPSIVTRTSPASFNAPLRWMEPKIIFTCSWGDFFHETADPWRDEAWDIIRRTPQHTYLILTKRLDRVRKHLPWKYGKPWPHVWLGLTVENQAIADRDVPPFVKIPAARRFLSIEPLVGPIDWLMLPYTGLHWAIIGGCSGSKFKKLPMEIAWMADLVKQFDNRIPVFVKQDCARKDGQQGRIPDEIWKHKVRVDEIPEDAVLRAAGMKVYR